VSRARAQARAAGIEDAAIFAGERPAAEIPAYLLACDVLVSPRSRGTNTPLKIYQYLRSGKPIVATRLLTHTQVLSDQTAILTGASPSEFAEGSSRASRIRYGPRPSAGARVNSRRRNTATRRISSARGSRRGVDADAAVRRDRQGRGVKGDRDHYSYSVYGTARPRAHSTTAALGGPIGDLVASTQARVLTNMMGRIQGRDILDVGTGTGRAALLFARGGAEVTPSTRRRRCLPSPASAPPRRWSRSSSRLATRTRWTLPIAASTRSSVSAC